MEKIYDLFSKKQKKFMRKVVCIVLLSVLGYLGYSQDKQLSIMAFYPQVPDTFEWTENQIIDILEKGDVLFCKLDFFMERGDSNFYVKNMEIPLVDSIFDTAYLESSIFYGPKKKDQKGMRCAYIIINDKFGSQLEITEEALRHLPKLSNYLNDKIRKTRFKESKGYTFLD